MFPILFKKVGLLVKQVFKPETGEALFEVV